MQFGKCQYCKNNGKKCKHIMAYAISALGQIEYAINYCQSKNIDKYENEKELGYNSPCTNCKRIAPDNYEKEEK